MKAHILVADDEAEIRNLVALYLESEGFAVSCAVDGYEALEKAALPDRPIDLYLLDVMMPGPDGYQLCRRLRERTEVPIVLLTCRDEESDKVLGLGLGADDYITKPFSLLELVARVKAHLRRYHRLTGSTVEDILEFGSLRLDTAGRRVTLGGDEVSLTATEYGILEFMARHAGRVLTRAQIFEAVWEEPFVEDDGTVMVHIRHLREKLENDPAHPRLITTIRGLGYRFEGKPYVPH